MISTAGDDQGTFGPPLLFDVTVLASGDRELDHLWFYDGKAPHGAGMATKHVGRSAIVQIPYPDGTICGA